MAESIGIMSKAFFVPKTELLAWVNDFFKLNYGKVEDCCTGALHCQVLDSIYPGKVPLHKVNFNARADYEYVTNYKVLQSVFDKAGVKKHVPVDRLIKGKYQDNLEFLQWIKNFWDHKYGGQDYDALVRREEAMSRYNKGRRHARSGGASGAPRAARQSGGAPGASRAARPARQSGGAPGAGRAARPARQSGGASAADTRANEKKTAELNERLTKLRVTVEGLEKERNFYFGKLREIEVLCQDDEDAAPASDEAAQIKAKILEILYATDDNDEFEAPADEEEEPLPDDEEPIDDEDDGLSF